MNLKHRVIKSKMKKTKPLLNDPILSRHVPETVWFSVPNVQTMLEKHSTIYVKPDEGRQGKGVLRLKALQHSTYEIAHENMVKELSYEEALQELISHLTPKKRYVIQQGINLATYKQCPFDIRVIMQKPIDRWQLSITSAKIANSENSVVTYVLGETKEHSIEKVLQNNDQKLNPMYTLRELFDLSHQIANVLGSHFPFRIIGLDMGVDKEGKVWFIEANSKPDCRWMRGLNDERSYEKYLEAEKLMREGLSADFSKHVK